MKIAPYGFYFVYQILFIAIKGDESVNIDKCDSCRNYIFENRFHPRTHFHTDAHVGFFNEVIPTPAELVATEQSSTREPRGRTFVETMKSQKSSHVVPSANG